MTDIVELCKALRAYKQADADGVMVLVSRQACDEAAAEIERLRVENETLDVMTEVGFDGWMDKGAEITRLRAAIERLRAALTAIASMKREDLYYADGQKHDNAASAYAASALANERKGDQGCPIPSPK